MSDLVVRTAEARDAAACRAVYAPYVEGTVVSFEDEVPTEAEMAARIAAANERHAWLVAERDGRVVGYAYGGPFRTRAAYRWSCEVSVYVDRDHHRAGLGRTLYLALLERMRARGMRTACGGVALPNDASVALHRSLGFETIGTYRRIGWKLGGWHDVAWFQLALDDAGERTTGEAEPAEPR